MGILTLTRLSKHSIDAVIGYDAKYNFRKIKIHGENLLRI
jgi:hypothetical protein